MSHTRKYTHMDEQLVQAPGGLGLEGSACNDTCLPDKICCKKIAFAAMKYAKPRSIAGRWMCLLAPALTGRNDHCLNKQHMHSTTRIPQVLPEPFPQKSAPQKSKRSHHAGQGTCTGRGRPATACRTAQCIQGNFLIHSDVLGIHCRCLAGRRVRGYTRRASSHQTLAWLPHAVPETGCTMYVVNR